MSKSRAKHAGITVRHSKLCPAASGGTCTCSPSFRAEVYDVRADRKLRKTFRSLAAAKAWRAEAQVAIRKGQLTAQLTPTVREAAAAWLVGARAGAARNRSGDVFKPSAIRNYEQAFRLRIDPVFGAVRLADIRRGDLQAFVDRMLVDGTNPSTIRNTLKALRTLFRRAVVRGEIAVNPTIGLELPSVRGTRDRIASPEEAERLLAALAQDGALWATAMYAGLRLGELMGLEWDAVDVDQGVVEVRRAWDPEAGPIAPKSRAGLRTVPLAGVLRAYLLPHKLACPWSAGLVFGRGPERPFLPKPINDRAQRAWRQVGMRPIGLHECRHTFASFMIASGVNAEQLSTYMGHASVMV
jgi:integrase